MDPKFLPGKFQGSTWGELPPFMILDSGKAAPFFRTSRNLRITHQPSLGGGFKYFTFSPLFGEDSQFD